jgi:hypothetical protein
MNSVPSEFLDSGSVQARLAGSTVNTDLSGGELFLRVPSGRCAAPRRPCRYSLVAAILHLRKEPDMATSHFQQFLSDATCPAPDTDHPLGPDCLYGLYTSWCLLHGLRPKPDALFRAGMRLQRIDVRGGKLRMKGRAAADYILSSYPDAG